MNILSIGNSFSQDAQRYLHQIARTDGVKLNVYNIMIGGCPLSLHYRNMLSELKEYTMEVNGVNTGFKISLKEALLNRDWDVVTVQQVSSKSPYYETYQPYLDKLVEYIRFCVPKVKIALHQTWAYEDGSELLKVEMGYMKHSDMFKDIKSSYEKAAEAIKADIFIPSGELFYMLVEAGMKKVHRDTFHASLGLGRYALGLLWYQCLTNNKISDNSFNDFDEDILIEELEFVKSCVEKLESKNN